MVNVLSSYIGCWIRRVVLVMMEGEGSRHVRMIVRRVDMDVLMCAEVSAMKSKVLCFIEECVVVAEMD